MKQDRLLFGVCVALLGIAVVPQPIGAGPPVVQLRQGLGTMLGQRTSIFSSDRVQPFVSSMHPNSQ